MYMRAHFTLHVGLNIRLSRSYVMYELAGGVHTVRHSERIWTSMEMVMVSGLIYSPRALLSCIIRVQASSSSLYGMLEMCAF